MYILAYRNLGIFYENAVNRILRDFVRVAKPIKAVVTGEFNIRGGMKTMIVASYPPK
jgi:7-cyano-7-deazaguanine reductase